MARDDHVDDSERVQMQGVRSVATADLARCSNSLLREHLAQDVELYNEAAGLFRKACRASPACSNRFDLLELTPSRGRSA